VTVTIADKIEIQELCAALYLAVDGDDAAGFAATFAPDGVYVAAHGEIRGDAALHAFLRGYWKGVHRPGDRHFVANQIIEPHEAGARLRFNVVKLNAAFTPAVVVPARADCLIARKPGGWHFLRFQLIADAGA